MDAATTRSTVLARIARTSTATATAAAGLAVIFTLATRSLAAESFVDDWENGLPSCWTGNTPSTDVDVLVDVIFQQGQNGWIRSIATGGVGSQAGIATTKPEVVGDWTEAQVSSLTVDVKRVVGTPTSCSFRVRAGATINGWNYPLPAGAITDEWTTLSAPVDPEWTDGQAMAAGWVRDNEITLNWQATMEGHAVLSVRASSGGTGLRMGYDNFELIADASACQSDVDGNGTVNIADLLAVLAEWDTCECCFQDVNRDQTVDIADLLQVLSEWGGCAG